VALRGWATFAWQSDYGQFYLIDRGEPSFQPPMEITAEIESRSLFVPPTGLVIYTNDCLQQHVRISIYDVEPEPPPNEIMSGSPWTRVGTARPFFPSRKFSLSSPSSPDPLPNGPIFLLDAAAAEARICWKEFQGSRDDSIPVEPDVIDIALWPSMPAS
jgi:hypothetical protein